MRKEGEIGWFFLKYGETISNGEGVGIAFLQHHGFICSSTEVQGLRKCILNEAVRKERMNCWVTEIWVENKNSQSWPIGFPRLLTLTCCPLIALGNISNNFRKKKNSLPHWWLFEEIALCLHLVELVTNCPFLYLSGITDGAFLLHTTNISQLDCQSLCSRMSRACLTTEASTVTEGSTGCF